MGVRAQARAETTDAIKRIARRQLAEEGPNLSLRAIARDLGLVSSAVYRYFASRDELLTALIVDAYATLADTAERGEAKAPRRDLQARWFQLGRAIRSWARANPHEYALLYGSPVPGYAAPPDTIEPATRPVLVFASILRDGAASGLAIPADRLPRALRADVGTMLATPGFAGVPPTLLSRGLTAWAQLFGTLSFELFGRLTGAVTDYDAFFDHQLKAMSSYLGLAR
jgi:AcrR family transcriptional regulator